MKFLIINNLYPPCLRGGAEKIVAQLAEGLRSRGEVVVITSSVEKTGVPTRENGVIIYRLNPGNFYYLTADWQQPAWLKIFWHLVDLFNWRVSAKVKKIILAEKPDYIFTHNLKGLSLRIFGALKKVSVPHLHTLHDYQLLDPHGSLFRQGQPVALSNPLYAVYRFFTRRLTNKVRLVVSPSAFVLNKHLTDGFFKQAKALAVPNPATTVLEEQRPAAVSSKIRFGFLGQLAEHKGAEFLVKAFKNWPEADAELLIAGSGEQSQQISAAAQSDSRIKVLGKVNNHELSQFFSLIDVLVVPSVWWENSPTVIAEAFAFGVPVLVSDAGGSKELVVEGKTGWIFKSGAADDLLAKLAMIADGRQNLPTMAANCRAAVKEFALEKYLDKLLALCQTLQK